MGYSERVKRSVDKATGREQPLGYVFMVGDRPRGEMRATRKHAVADAINAGEARVDMDYRKVFFSAMAWIAPIWP